MKHIFSIIFFLGICATAIGQPISASTYGTKLDLAGEAVASNDYYNALKYYKEAYDERKDKALIPDIADQHYKLRDYKKAESYYQRLYRKRRGKAIEVAPETSFKYARVLKINGKYDEAIAKLQEVISKTTDQTLKELAEYELNGAEYAKIARPVPRLEIKTAGTKVNTSFSEYSAIIQDDGNTMYFTTFDRNDVIILDGEDQDYHAKIFKSTKKDDKWGKPQALGEKINRPGFHTGNVTFTKDGQRMYFTRQLITGNEVSESKIFYADATGDGMFGAANELGGANGPWIAKHPAIGELFNKEVLFFVSDMDGGEGGMDLWYATHKGNGIYGDPVNMGPKINTTADEVTPFYRDGTLYFSSTGHPGIGGMDIFNTVWNGSIWSEPKNMGVGYNSRWDDTYFTIDQEGYNGTILSNREGTKSTHGKTCCDDIYEFGISKINVDALVGTFNGETKEPLLGANVQLFERKDGQLVPVDEQSDPSGNAYNFPLLLERSYIVIAMANGFYPDTSEYINTVGLTESKKIERRLRLKPMPKEPEYETVEISLNEPIRMNNIYYDYDDDKILPDAEIDLSQIFEWMTQYPDMVVELSSHTDSRGRDAYNMDLSQRRAESAKAWLVARNIVGERIQARGYGETQILNRCTNAIKCSDEEHRFNRRTEFKIISGPTSIEIKKTEKRLKVEEPKVQEKPAPQRPKRKKRKRRRRN